MKKSLLYPYNSVFNPMPKWKYIGGNRMWHQQL